MQGNLSNLTSRAHYSGNHYIIPKQRTGAEDQEALRFVDLMELSLLQHTDPWDLIVALSAAVAAKTQTDGRSNLQFLFFL